MSNWEKLPPIKGGHGGCLHCGYQYDEAPMDMIIAVGLGYAAVTRDGEEVYNEWNIPDDVPDSDEEVWWRVSKAEEMAQKDPDHDWRIILDAPLSMREYQRQDGKWMLVNKGPGFA